MEAEVSARVEADELVITVSDDGKGGANLAHGTGLRGLADRVQALDGDFSIDSPQGAGTRIVARIPRGTLN